jgi:hypothetical protein
MPESLLHLQSAPLVIGATGGSGTRVAARIAKYAGYDFGANLNSAEDALDFVAFHDRWINRLLKAEREKRLLPPTEANRMSEEFHEALVRHQSTIAVAPRGSSQPWGWKAPRSVYLLPFLHALFPALKYIHLLRDGRDMAFSKNQNQLRKHARQLLTVRERWFQPAPVRSLLLWDRVNGRAADYGEQHLGKNYLAVRFEDLCLAPRETTGRILHFLDSSRDPETIARAEISPPTSIGRWRKQAPALRARFDRAARRSLQRFGYDDGVA